MRWAAAWTTGWGNGDADHRLVLGMVPVRD